MGSSSRRGFLAGLLLLGLVPFWFLARRADGWSSPRIATNPFSFAVASAGPLRGRELVVDSALKRGAGTLVSAGLELGEGSRVTGDALCWGRVRLTGGAVVEGEIREGRAVIPLLELGVYDPGPDGRVLPDVEAGRSRVRGRVRREGALTIGDLHLDSGLLYVDGPLTVVGKVTGNGAIVVRGAVTVTGQMNLESDLVALVADGDVVVQGRGQDDGTRVQGLVYTKGSFKAQDSTIVGAVVSARVDGTTELDRVNMVQVPGVTDFEVVVDEQLEKVTDEGEAERRGFKVGLEYEGAFIQFEDFSASMLRDMADVLVTLPDSERGTVQIRDKFGQVVLNIPVGVQNAFIDKKEAWRKYLLNLSDNTLSRDEIFKLDLNSFLSVNGELEVLLWKNYRQRQEEQSK